LRETTHGGSGLVLHGGTYCHFLLDAEQGDLEIGAGLASPPLLIYYPILSFGLIKMGSQ
jgi:hypothetical protein